MAQDADATSSTKLSQFVMAKQWWKVCFLHGDQTKFYREIYGKAASRRIANSRKTSDWLKDQNSTLTNNKNDVIPINKSNSKNNPNHHYVFDYAHNFSDVDGPSVSLPDFHNQNFDRLRNKKENLYTKNSQHHGINFNNRRSERHLSQQHRSAPFYNDPISRSPRLEDSVIFGTEAGSMHCLTIEDVPKNDGLRKRSAIYDDSTIESLFQNKSEFCSDFRDAIESLHLFDKSPPIRDTSIDSGAGGDEAANVSKDSYT